MVATVEWMEPMLTTAPPPLLDHRQLGVHPVGHTVQVDRHRALPRLEVGLPERLGLPAHTGVVHGVVQPAVGLHREVHGRGGVVLVGDVLPDPGGVPAGGHDGLHHVVDPRGVHVRDHHLGALPGQVHGDCRPDPGGRSGDQRCA